MNTDEIGADATMNPPGVTLRQIKASKNPDQSHRNQLHQLLDKWLPLIAIMVGVFWFIVFSLIKGVTLGGDTEDYLLRTRDIFSSFSSFLSIYQHPRLTAHVSTIWMALLGAKGFALWVATLTIALPWGIVRLLRGVGVSVGLQCAALMFVAVNPEIFVWAWYVLTDGLFLLQPIVLLYVLILPGAWKYRYALFPLVLYHSVYTRPTGVLLVVPLIVTSFVMNNKRVGRYVLAVSLLMGAWSASWILTEGQTQNVHNSISKRTFITGHLLQDPRMSEPIATPFTLEADSNKTYGQLCTEEPGYCMKYYALKGAGYFMPIYPLYSAKHKVFNGIYFGSLIGLSLIGLSLAYIRRRISIQHKAFNHHQKVGAVFCFSAVLFAGFFHIVITHVDSDARFLMVWTPLWISGLALLWSLVLQKKGVSPLR